MKKLTLILFLLTTLQGVARDYYFSATGNDQGDASQNEPLKTIAKLNTLPLKPGDNVYFKKGDTFYGTISIKASGTAAAPIYIGSYGTGDKPVITGLQTLINWVNVGGGKYETTVTLPTELNMVTVNDVEQEMGRYPNSSAGNGGYLNFETHILKTSITDVQFINQLNWKGAELVVRTNRYIIDRVKITAHAGTTLTYSPALSYEPQNGFGYFIQNDIRTLDQLGEWFYLNKKLTVYFGSSSPSSLSVKAAGVENVVYIYNYDNIILDGLAINGGNQYSVYLYSAANITIKNCDIAFSGLDGVSANSTTNFKIENSTIKSSNNIGVNLSSSTRGIVRGNTIINSGLLTGMGQNHANKSVGIRETGNNNLIEYNSVTGSGYIGIRFGGDYAVIKNNLVDRYNVIKDDGGGIYTTDNGPKRKIIGNVVMNGLGAGVGTANINSGSTSGIYLDDDANDIEVTGNTIANNAKAGLLIHNAHEITVSDNIFYNNAAQQILMSHNLTSPTAPPIRNNTITGNTFFSKTGEQGAIFIYSVKNDVSLSAGTMDNNIYARPLGDNFSIKTQSVNNGVTTVQDLDLNLWKRTYGKDGNSFNGSKLLPYKVVSRIGDNKFVNGAFIKDIKGITFGTTGTAATKTWVSNGLDAGTLQIDINSPNKKSLTTVTAPIAAVSKDKKYVISFSVKNSKDTFMYAYARQAGSPYKVLSNNGAKTLVNIGQDRQEIEIAFQPPIDNLGTSIFLETPAQTSRLLLDNIKIYEADVKLTNADDSIKLVSNPSQVERVIQLPGKYSDPQGIIYNGDIALQPYQSAILTWKENTTIPPVDTVPIPPDTIPDVPVPTDTLPKVRLINNDPDTITTAKISLTAIASAYHGIKKVEIFNGKKIIHTEWIYPYDFTWENIPPGNYEFKARVVDKHNNLTMSAPVLVLVRTQ